MAEQFAVKQMTAAQGRQLIQRLASDDAFRKDLQNNPEKTLARFNISIPSTFVGPNFTVPPKAVFRRMQTDLRLAPGAPAAAEVVFLAFFAFFNK